MGHYIIEAEHGDPQMFLLAGPFLCDREVIKELAGPIYSAEGVRWFFAVEGDRDVIGFCTVRETPTAYWFDYEYVVPDRRGEGVFTDLAKARDDYLRTREPRPLKIACTERRWPHYEARGWRVQSKRGSWVYGVNEVGVWT